MTSIYSLVSSAGVFLLVAILLFCNPVFAQPNFPDNGILYNNELVPRIDILIEQDALDLIYEDVDSDFEHPATFVFSDGTNRDTLFDIGFRLKGNTSRNSEKKSFKISLNTYVPGQKYDGVEKINLNGNTNDPTLIRPKLGFDLCRMMDLPASRMNFIDLYINNEFYGVYGNTEHYDEEFVDKRYGNNEGNLYKCTWPADMKFISTNPSAYDLDAYDLKINEAQNNRRDLATLIDVLSNASEEDFECEIEAVFNVQDYLKYAALEVMTGHWDGPIYNKNNFYLYFNKSTGLMEFIPYDLDNTLGVDWLGIDWRFRSIYNFNSSQSDRPIYEPFMANEKYRNQYTDYIKQIAAIFNSTEFENHIMDLKNLIQPSVESDPYYSLDYGYTIQNFNDAYTSGLAGGSFHDDQTGLLDFISTRASSAESEAENSNAQPVIKYVDYEGGFLGADIYISAHVSDDQSIDEVIFSSQINGGATTEMILLDDGNGADLVAGDNIYSVVMNDDDIETLLYRFIATDNSGQQITYPICAPLQLNFGESTLALHINEFMPSNSNAHMDEAGEFDDWIEIYNSSDEAIDLSNVYLTDNLDQPNKYQFPNVDIPAKGFVLVWADNDSDQGVFHADFKLSGDGEQIGLFEKVDNAFVKIDDLVYEGSDSDLSYGCFPDGVRPIVEQPEITPERSNDEVSTVLEIASLEFSLSPNPANLFFKVIIPGSRTIEVGLLTILGRQIKNWQNVRTNDELSLEGLQEGLYFVKVKQQGGGAFGVRKIFVKRN